MSFSKVIRETSYRLMRMIRGIVKIRTGRRQMRPGLLKLLLPLTPRVIRLIRSIATTGAISRGTMYQRASARTHKILMGMERTDPFIHASPALCGRCQHSGLACNQGDSTEDSPQSSLLFQACGRTLGHADGANSPQAGLRAHRPRKGGAQFSAHS